MPCVRMACATTNLRIIIRVLSVTEQVRYRKSQYHKTILHVFERAFYSEMFNAIMASMAGRVDGQKMPAYPIRPHLDWRSRILEETYEEERMGPPRHARTPLPAFSISGVSRCLSRSHRRRRRRNERERRVQDAKQRQRLPPLRLSVVSNRREGSEIGRLLSERFSLSGMV